VAAIIMAEWDVFHSERLEAERSLTTEDVRDALARGGLVEDDLIRPSGSTRWTRLGDLDEFAGPAAPAAPLASKEPMEFAPPSIDEDYEDEAAEGDISRFEIDPTFDVPLDREDLARIESEPPPDFEIEVEEEVDEPVPAPVPLPADRPPSSLVAMPATADELTERSDLDDLEIELDFEEPDPQDEDEEAAEFTLSRNSPERVEELDLAAMVDVAFQLVLFFLVTTATVVFKTLEVPRPNEDKPPEAAAQARSKSIDELEKDYILVEVDAAGALKVDRQPVPSDRAALAEKLRAARQATGRKAMLLSADFATRHENAVLAFDVANEVDLAIAIAQPTGKK
jgi:biopolymer transport protein ExbD